MIELNLKAKPVNLFPLCLDKYDHCKSKVGSRVICVPTPLDTDDDRLIWFIHPDDLEKAVQELEKEEWVRNKDYGLDENFVSMKHPKNNINLIMTKEFKFYSRFLLAVAICRKFNTIDKEDRVWVHDRILEIE